MSKIEISCGEGQLGQYQATLFVPPRTAQIALDLVGKTRAEQIVYIMQQVLIAYTTLTAPTATEEAEGENS
jgi:hypothetical protein